MNTGGTPTNQLMPSPHRARRCEIPGFGTENGLSATKLEEWFLWSRLYICLKNGGKNPAPRNFVADKKCLGILFFWGEINVYFFGFF